MEPQQQPSNSKGRKVGIGIAIVAILALIGITIGANKKSDSSQTAQPSPMATAGEASTSTASSSLPPTTPPSTPAAAAALYKDGTYSATGSYISPGGADQVGVTLTLKGDIVTALTVTPMPGDNTSAHYQALFASGIKQYVVGQDITKLNVHKVSGSSLTSQGFNAAIAQIEAQAKA